MDYNYYKDFMLIVLKDRLIIDPHMDTYSAKYSYNNPPVFIFHGRDNLALKQFLSVQPYSELPIEFKDYNFNIMPCRHLVSVIYSILDMCYGLKYD